MLLPQQIQAILYHFIMGWGYACIFSFMISFLQYLRFPILKGIVEILFHIVFTLSMYYGLYHINGGITNAYLITFFCLGIFVYISLYLKVFLQLVYSIKRMLHPIKRKLIIVKAKILGIIYLPTKYMKRRIANAKSKSNKKKRNKKEKKASAESPH